MTLDSAVTAIYGLIFVILGCNIIGLIWVYFNPVDDELIYAVDCDGELYLVHTIGCGTAKEYPI